MKKVVILILIFCASMATTVASAQKTLAHKTVDLLQSNWSDTDPAKKVIFWEGNRSFERPSKGQITGTLLQGWYKEGTIPTRTEKGVRFVFNNKAVEFKNFLESLAFENDPFIGSRSEYKNGLLFIWLKTSKGTEIKLDY